MAPRAPRRCAASCDRVVRGQTGSGRQDVHRAGLPRTTRTDRLAWRVLRGWFRQAYHFAGGQLLVAKIHGRVGLAVFDVHNHHVSETEACCLVGVRGPDIHRKRPTVIQNALITRRRAVPLTFGGERNHVPQAEHDVILGAAAINDELPNWLAERVLPFGAQNQGRTGPGNLLRAGPLRRGPVAEVEPFDGGVGGLAADVGGAVLDAVDGEGVAVVAH